MSINIVCSINSVFLQHFCVMAMSVVSNTNHTIHFHIINNDLTNEDKQLVNKVFKKYNYVSVSFYTIEDKLLEDIKIQAEHLTIQALYRLLIPEILPHSINKVIYLDSDLLVNSNIANLYDIDVEDYYIAAVNEIFEPSTILLKLNSSLDYFNSGVMIINLKKWREDAFLQKCLVFAKNNQDKLLLADQDILNGVLKGEWKRIPLEWNLVKGIWIDYQEYCKRYSKVYIDTIIEKPNIIHFTTPSKPWHWLCDHPYKEKYFYYLNITGLSYVKYPELSYLNSKNNIYIFGSGKAGQETLKILEKQNTKIKGFYDNNVDLWGISVNGIEVYDPKKCKSGPNDFIIIASMYYKDISKQLKNYGLKEYKNFCRIEYLHKLQ
ncbi:lipopolysaccharide biosynthesis glycosyltransferase [Ureibacillus xyleni]|uniref:Lipopolysaccharide biosynthesis glycosyltransferase n=1 Tax=Ureibacillus xyleni TaxID=614648 RepID=A0A285RB92_9BACL|nr:glycosyltransferase family 8 protein [Ureibacillus xyleni]SOB91174.1 lipopolysaccharide biosynthesis glycosyltransferase [Ureibacillus xyleni]